MSTIVTLRYPENLKSINLFDTPESISKLKDFISKEVENKTKNDSEIGSTNDQNILTEYVNLNLSFDYLKLLDKNLSNNKEQRFLKTQKWVGYITEINEYSFFANLQDLNLPNSTNEIGEFEIEDIPYEDRDLVSKGACFYFSIGQAYDKFGQLEKRCLIRFQRSVSWSDETLNSIIDEADKLYENLKFK